MANGKNSASKLAIVSAMPEAEVALIEQVRGYGAAKGSGDASWENVADTVILGCGQKAWVQADFTSPKRGTAPVKDVGAILLNAFYDGAETANKKLIRPVEGTATYDTRVGSLRTIGKAACKHGADFKNSLRGSKGIVDKYLMSALKSPKKGPNGKTVQPYSAYEVICRASAAAIKRDDLAFTDAEIQSFLYSKSTPKAEGLQALVDSVGKMVETLRDATQGYKEKKDGAETDVPALCADKELTDAYKSLSKWHAVNKAKGTQKKTRGKVVNFADMDPVQFAALAAAAGFKVTKSK